MSRHPKYERIVDGMTSDYRKPTVRAYPTYDSIRPRVERNFIEERIAQDEITRLSNQIAELTSRILDLEYALESACDRLAVAHNSVTSSTSVALHAGDVYRVELHNASNNRPKYRGYLDSNDLS